jgi:hypothetical protein
LRVLRKNNFPSNTLSLMNSIEQDNTLPQKSYLLPGYSGLSGPGFNKIPEFISKFKLSQIKLMVVFASLTWLI